MITIFIAISLMTLAPVQGANDKTALEKMEAVYIGDFSRWEIKSSMDRVLRAYGKEITERQYEKLGSALVGMRKNTRVPEMVIAKCTVELKKQVTKSLSLPDAIGMCAGAFEGKYK